MTKGLSGGCDLGIYLDSDVSMKTHVSKTVASCFASLRQIRSIQRSNQQYVVTMISSAATFIRRNIVVVSAVPPVVAAIFGVYAKLICMRPHSQVLPLTNALKNHRFATMDDLNGKVALITGASSGIGAASARLFARRGAKLSLVGRNEVNLQRVGDECECLGPTNAEPPLLVIADLCCEADVTRLVDTTIKKLDHLDILVNNAGILEYGTLETTSLEQYDRVMRTNVRSAYQLTMLCVPHLIATRGNIINVSSIYGTRSSPGCLAYCLSKSAMDQMTRCTALELASKGVRVNSVNPGIIITDIQKRAGLSDEEYPKYIERKSKSHPLGRVGSADEVAAAIAFLASSAAAFVTGEHLHVDGGRHATCAR